MLPGGALCAEAPGPGEEDDMRRYQTEGSRRLHQQTVPYLLDGVGSSFHVSSYRDYPVAMTLSLIHIWLSPMREACWS